ncbi:MULTISPECIES: hypothetical protein [Heyndrickxia]|nr:hypothetical protein [Heyndrickxia shackletonii]MBB2481996.1 hypothetical protein [Bacillus sp. APMAM]
MRDEKREEKTFADLFGVDADMSLQSVHFAATSENRYLNEHVQEEKE